MTASSLTLLREKTEQLKPVAEALSQQVDASKNELNELNKTIDHYEIELSIIRDAFRLKYGEMSDTKRLEYIEAMKQLSEVENLEKSLENEMEQVKFLQNEIKRKTGLIPDMQVEEINLDAITNQKHELEKRLKQTKIRNAKYIKAIKNNNSQISAIQEDIKKLDQQLEDRIQKENEIKRLQQKANEIKLSNEKLTNEYKDKNRQTTQIQQKLADALEQIAKLEQFENDHADATNIAAEQEKFNKIIQYITEANKPYEEAKLQSLRIRQSAIDAKNKLSSQLDEINSLLASLYQRVK